MIQAAVSDVAAPGATAPGEAAFGAAAVEDTTPEEAAPEESVPVSAEWLQLREPADAAARSAYLVRLLRRDLPRRAVTVVHDLGCGTGSMGRWLAPLLSRPQHWVLHDRDVDLLARAEDHPPAVEAGGAPVTVETRQRDLRRLQPTDLSGASLVTAAALLDMLTVEEIELLVGCCVEAGCPTLVTLSVTGQVTLAPRHPLDRLLCSAFNDHQRRTTAGRALLGPDAVHSAVRLFRSSGADVVARPSPWELDARSSSLTSQWLRGWVGAACEQRPELADAGAAYLAARSLDLHEGRLRVRVHHLDVLARPPAAHQ